MTQAHFPRLGKRKKRLGHIGSNLYLLAIGTSLILAACTTNQPKISVEANSFTFGDVVNGQVEIKNLEIRNIGNGILRIEAVSTSCGCTTATMDSMIISPGDSAKLRIEFDSGAHGPDENGQIIRQIFIASNDPQQKELIIDFEANILPAN